MSTSQIFLVLLSGLGVLHGLLLAAFLWFHPKGLSASNKTLSLLLLILSFRIGKSVILEFAETAHLNLIFVGLATLLLIGPLFYFYTRSVLEKTLRFSSNLLLHFIPAVIAIIFSLWINKTIVDKTPTPVFVVMFCFYYAHYLLYLFVSYRLIRNAKKQPDQNDNSVQWLSLLFYALAALWLVYVFNLLEESIPYILGPVLYSVIVYGVSFIAIKRGFINHIADSKYKTTPSTEAEVDEVFKKIKKLVSEQKLYKDPDLTLSMLSQTLKVSPQKISMAINLRASTNLNGFINYYRINEAQVLMQSEKFRSYTIASIAYEVGFHSLTSFNAAFKKETKKTPSAFRKELKL